MNSRDQHGVAKEFDAADRDDLIILQHMLAGVNAHIDLDLGITAQNIAPATKLPKLHATSTPSTPS